MTITAWGAKAAERGQLPDWIVRKGIRSLCRARLQQPDCLRGDLNQESLERLVEQLRASPIALVPDLANQQHYEVPAGFFEQVLGPHRKYSCCLWDAGVETLEAAEQRALEVTCERAELFDGARILELGCGWGSLTLFMAARYPKAQVTAVSNSASQRAEIERLAAARGLRNVTILTADMNDFQAPGVYDRVVSVEMFEHMRNYGRLLERIAGWLTDEGRLFVHIFTHRTLAYPFETDGPDDWMGQYFFTGGLMPSEGLLLRFPDHLRVDRQWRWNGQHYARTCNAWLALQDARRERVLPILEQAYGARDTQLWYQRWRMFFMACAELFDMDGGEQWGVSHYRFVKPGRGTVAGPGA